jgi:hypothetical protein
VPGVRRDCRQRPKLEAETAEEAKTMNRTVRRRVSFTQQRDPKSSAGRRDRPFRKVLLACGVVSSVLYIAADVLASLRYQGYSYVDQTFSELLAAGAPTRPLMIVLAGIGYTTLVTDFGVGVWTAGGNSTARRTGALLVGYALVGAVTGIVFRMNTREVLAAGADDWRNALHGPGTIVQSLFVVLAIGVGARLLRQPFGWYSYATIATLLVFGVVTGLAIPRMTANEPTPWMGAIERVNIYATMLWVAVLAGSLLRVHGTRSTQPTGKPALTPHLRPG